MFLWYWHSDSRNFDIKCSCIWVTVLSFLDHATSSVTWLLACPWPITVRHGSADTVVRAMNDFNGKYYFSGPDSSETFWRIWKKFCTVDFVGDPTPHANVGAIGSKGACLRMREVVAVRRLFFFFPFLGPMRIATGRPVAPMNAINGSNDASCWHSHSLYGLDNKS